jgi:hypothetical protein
VEEKYHPIILAQLSCYFFEARSMLPHQSLHVMRNSSVFVVVLCLCRNQARFLEPSVRRSVVCTRQQVLLTRRRALAPPSPPIRSWWVPIVLVVSLMVRGLLVRACGIHVPSPTTLYAHINRPMLFCFCSSFFKFVLCCYPCNLHW